ncbi:MAG: 3-keto-disaccharide hydrolase [Planctomycetota bacterium]
MGGVLIELKNGSTDMIRSRIIRLSSAAGAAILAAAIASTGFLHAPAGASESEKQAASTSVTAPAAPEKSAETAPDQKTDSHRWRDLFDGKTMKGWKVADFGGNAAVEVRDGKIVMDQGSDMSGIVYDGKPPRTNYELRLEGMRVDGSDFFATTTFPVGDKCCSFVVGGWGGTVVGLSCVDGFDASENPTTEFEAFKNDRWYKIRIRVSDSHIEAWIDDTKYVDLPRKDHNFDIRLECDPCVPLGVATWCTSGAVRNIRLRELTPEEVKQIPDGLD